MIKVSFKTASEEEEMCLRTLNVDVARKSFVSDSVSDECDEQFTRGLVTRPASCEVVNQRLIFLTFGITLYCTSYLVNQDPQHNLYRYC